MNILSEIVVAGASGGLIHGFIMLLVFVVVAVLVWWFGKWVFGQIGAPGIVLKGWDIIWAFVALIVVINFLLGLGGHSFVTW